MPHRKPKRATRVDAVALPFLIGLFFLLPGCKQVSSLSHDPLIKEIDAIDGVWDVYRYQYIQEGRVVSLDENNRTTSEGQGYGMLRAVWVGDQPTFEKLWQWTRQHLQVRGDPLFAWQWNEKVVDINSATDADTDIALALVLASRRFSHPDYQAQALPIIRAIWDSDILKAGGRYFVGGGSWSGKEPYPQLHVAYMAPYAYQVFRGVDKEHPWEELVANSYRVLNWLYVDQRVALPPEFIFLNPQTGQLYLAHPTTGVKADFGYDAYPLFWRMALDAHWFVHGQWRLRRKMLAFFQKEWKERGLFWDRYSVDGTPLSHQEGLALYATVHSLALNEDRRLANALWAAKLSPLWENAQAGQNTTYYLHNWLWFDQAYEFGLTRHYKEYFDFLLFDTQAFTSHVPWIACWLMLALYLLSPYSKIAKALFLAPAFYIGVRYLSWRCTSSLNFMEPFGPFISVSLWAVECYGFLTVLLLLVQMGLGGGQEPTVTPAMPENLPTVDILIPIYQESCAILERTLIGAAAIRYPRKTIYVSDDSHRSEVEAMALQHGAVYIRGPQKFAKAGNLNHALAMTSGELLVIFDTDHIPSSSFLEETVPFFKDPKMAFVQTPHHFYNDDIFQRTFRLGRDIPNEQVMFHHAIQNARNAWNGAFFVGSGALFRRTAIEAVGGFNPMSLTEDIHTSQSIHAAGWKSAFVNKDLLSGLNAETLSSYVVQRRRWMLGGLQIFFKDNPLFCRGLSLRQRLGYFASLLYFFFPIARVVIWITPLYFLLFHMHPILADTSVLMAYLVPYMISLLMLGDALVPGWPRLIWQELYEMTITFPLLISMLDFFRPQKLGFKVTPKGVVTSKRTFAADAAWLTRIMTVVSLIGVAKGLFECFYFGVEQDAFFFNLGWSIYFLFVLIGGLLVAWERPQRRPFDRIHFHLPFRLVDGSFHLDGVTQDISLSGMSFITTSAEAMPDEAHFELRSGSGIVCRARLISHEILKGGRYHSAWAFSDLSPEAYQELVRVLYASADLWEKHKVPRVRSNVSMVVYLIRGMLNYFRTIHSHQRKSVRHRDWNWGYLDNPGRRETVLVTNRSRAGWGGLYFGNPPQENVSGTFEMGKEPNSVRVIYGKSLLPWVWRIGLRKSPRPENAPQPDKPLST